MTNIKHIPLVQIGQEVAELHLLVYFQDGGCPPCWICYSPVLDHPRSPLDGLYLLCQWRNYPAWSSDVTERLRFYVFGNLAGKCLFAPHLGQFVRHNRRRVVRHLTQRESRSRNETARVRETHRETHAKRYMISVQERRHGFESGGKLCERSEQKIFLTPHFGQSGIQNIV